jgi:hypothetical protein
MTKSNNKFNKKKISNIGDYSYEAYYDAQGVLHKEDGPARIWNDGVEEWYINGRLHRDNDLPAFKGRNKQIWYQHGKVHRVGKPAVLYEYEGANHTKREEWHVDGKCHKLDGPAILKIITSPDSQEEVDRAEYWYVNNTIITIY